MELTLLNAGWAKDDERWNFGPICSTYMRIYWVTRGSAYVTLNGKEHMLTEGHFYLIPPVHPAEPINIRSIYNIMNAPAKAGTFFLS